MATKQQLEDAGVQWTEVGTPEAPKTLRYFDALWSVCSNVGEFYEAIQQPIRQRVKRGMPADEALAEALREVFKPIEPTMRRMLREALEDLHAKGVPQALLLPLHLSEDWGKTQLSSKGDLVLRLRMGPIKNPAMYTEQERGGIRILWARRVMPRVVLHRVRT